MNNSNLICKICSIDEFRDIEKGNKSFTVVERSLGKINIAQKIKLSEYYESDEKFYHTGRTIEKEIKYVENIDNIIEGYSIVGF